MALKELEKTQRNKGKEGLFGGLKAGIGIEEADSLKENVFCALSKSKRDKSAKIFEKLLMINKERKEAVGAEMSKELGKKLLGALKSCGWKEGDEEYKYNKVLDVVSLIIEGADLNTKDEVNGFNLLEVAVWENCNEKIVGLFARINDVNQPLESQNWKGWTPLMLACLRENKKNTEVLIRNGANVNQKVKENGPWKGFTPLMVGAMRENCEICDILLMAGASLLARNKKGENAIDICVEDQTKRMLTKHYLVEVERRVKSRKPVSKKDFGNALSSALNECRPDMAKTFVEYLLYA